MKKSIRHIYALIMTAICMSIIIVLYGIRHVCERIVFLIDEFEDRLLSPNTESQKPPKKQVTSDVS
jgi:hypothetical protein